MAQMEARLNDLTREGIQPSQPTYAISISASNNDTLGSGPDQLMQSLDDSPLPNPSLSTSSISLAIQMYFEQCHRQPIWLFNLDEIYDHGRVADEIAVALLALMSSFTSHRPTSSYHRNLRSARKIVMSHVADGSVRLSTVEAVCIISHACFLGQLAHLLQCRCWC